MEALYVWRRASGMTLDDIRRRVPPTRYGTMIPHAQWYRVEKRNRIPHNQHLQRYCQALGVTYADIFGVQAIVEERLAENNNVYDLREHWFSVIKEYAKRRGGGFKQFIKCKPGPMQFEVNKIC